MSDPVTLVVDVGFQSALVSTPVSTPLSMRSPVKTLVPQPRFCSWWKTDTLAARVSVMGAEA